MASFADRYEILSNLGQGGNGIVYKVHDTKLGRKLALKLLSDGEESLVVREAHALTALESPHVLRVFNAGVHHDVPFIATEIAALGSTEDQIEPGIGVPPEQAVRWVRHALVGLDYCHRQRVLHRDITPGNVFLQTVDHALLGDFGIATNIDAEGTAPPAGNQRCRAPEGFGGRLTARSDLFSTAATLWRLLTGAWPYDADTEDELARMMRAADRPRLRDIAPHVHRSIAGVVEHGLHPDPMQRPDSASDMARMLANTQVHQRRWVRRPPDPGTDLAFESTSGGAQIRITVRSDGKTRIIESRRATTGNRLTAGCVDTTGKRLPVELRRILDTL